MRVHIRRVVYGGWIVILVALMAACSGDDPAPRESAAVVNPPAPSGPSDTTLLAQSQPTQEPLAARVNGEPITLRAFERERQRRLLGLELEPATAAAFDASVLETMIDQLLIEQAAAAEGLTVPDKTIDEELAIQQQLAEASGQTLEEIVEAQLYTIDEYRDVIHDMLLVGMVSDVVADVSPYSEQIHSRHILVADEATARSLLAQIQGGADFAQLARDYSLDASTARTGGDLDWVSEGDLLQPEIEAAIYALAPGELAAEPVRSSLGYHVVQTLERVQDRPLTPAALAEKRQRVFLTWLDGQRAAATIERFIDS